MEEISTAEMVRPEHRLVRLTFQRLVVLFIVAALSLLLTVGFVMSQPIRYKGSAIVFLSKLFPDRSGLEVDPFVATFQLALTLPESTRVTSRVTGVPAQEIARGLSSSRATQGTIVTVAFEGFQQQQAAMVPREAALATLRSLAEQDAAQANTRLQQARAALQTAKDDLLAFEESTGFADLDAQIETQRQQLSALRAAQPSTSAEVGSVMKRYVDLGALVAERDVLINRLERAKDDVTKAEGNVGSVAASRATVDAPGLVTQGKASPVRPIAAVARGVVGSLLVAVAGGLGSFALIDARRARRIQPLALPGSRSVDMSPAP